MGKVTFRGWGRSQVPPGQQTVIITGANLKRSTEKKSPKPKAGPKQPKPQDQEPQD